MIQRVLCPTDLTENSRDSVAYALRLAKENGAELIIFSRDRFSELQSIFLRVAALSSMGRVGVAGQDGSDPCGCRRESERFYRSKIQSRGRRRSVEAQSSARQSLRGDRRGSVPGGSRSYRYGPLQKTDARPALKK
jgi:hypothetical protein